MVCQNCNKNDANMHMKRIINGRAAEVHLCSDCARSLGYGEAFSGFGIGFGELLGEVLSRGDSLSSQACHLCGKTFEDIAADGKMGCAECYNTFRDKLVPYLNRIHGKATHVGKKPTENTDPAERLAQLKNMLQSAVDEQNFELAVKLRDEIIELSGEGGVV